MQRVDGKHYDVQIKRADGKGDVQIKRYEKGGIMMCKLKGQMDNQLSG